MSSQIKTAVIGVGYLGKFHAEKYAALPSSELVAVVDADQKSAQAIADKLGVQAYFSHTDILDKVDAVSIAAPTSLHHKIALDCLQHGIHVLVEKPISVTVDEANELIAAAKQHQCKLQVGHLERFNPAVIALNDSLQTPTFIEAHRLAPFKPRATDVNVILDLMIHDIDIILNLVKTDVEQILASGAKVLSDSIDIANVRIVFANGGVANVTASRVSSKTERKMRIFQENNCLGVDFQNRTLTQHSRSEQLSDEGVPIIDSKENIFDNNDPLRTEIESFLNCISNDTAPIVSGEDGKRALETALHISDLIHRSNTEKTT